MNLKGHVATLSPPLNRLAIVVAVLVMLTSSFDIFLVVQAGGTYRFCQLISPVLVVLAAVQARRSGFIPTISLAPLCIWFGFQVIFIPLSDFWQKSLGYCLWLALNIALVCSFVQLFSRNSRLFALLVRWYVYSFGLVAAFGLVQFSLPLVGYTDIFVTQWWIKDQLPRVNGFSYEPSYFASYLLIGFVLTGGLDRQRTNVLKRKRLLAIRYTTAVAIVVSSSRMGIVFMLLDIVFTSAGPWASFIIQLGQKRLQRQTIRRLLPSLLCLGLIFGLGAEATLALEDKPAILLMLLNGTGISDTAAHSVVQRADALEDTLQVFADNPVFGRSLGGVSSAIADLHGEHIASIEDSKLFEGMNVFAEVLAASGIVGVVPFVIFVVETIRRPLRLAVNAAPADRALLRALVRSLVAAWVVLQFNQNMLRPYLWVHIAILATAYAAAAQKQPSGTTMPVRPVARPERLADR